MTARGHHYGHAMAYIDGEWRYEDTGEPVATTYKSRSCGHCGRPPTPEGHDGCLGTLPGVMNACCGHGGTSEAYVQFTDGHSIRGRQAQQMIPLLKMNRDFVRAQKRLYGGKAVIDATERIQRAAAAFERLGRAAEKVQWRFSRRKTGR